MFDLVNAAERFSHHIGISIAKEHADPVWPRPAEEGAQTVLTNRRETRRTRALYCLYSSPNFRSKYFSSRSITPLAITPSTPGRRRAAPLTVPPRVSPPEYK
jgi:hypothetical protein